MLLSRLQSSLSCMMSPSSCAARLSPLLVSSPPGVPPSHHVAQRQHAAAGHNFVTSLVLPARMYSAGLVNKSLLSFSSAQSQIGESNLLLKTLISPVVQQIAGLKHKGILKRRCRHCYFIIHEERRYVMCTVHPRHKQVGKEVATKEGNMILTHATQGSKRKNGKSGSRHMKTQASFRLDF